MDGLVDAIALALAIGDTAQARAGQQADAAGDDAGLVRDNVAKQVARDDDAVEGGGVLDHNHGGAVDELVLDLEVRELLFKHLGHDLAPQAARGQELTPPMRCSVRLNLPALGLEASMALRTCSRVSPDRSTGRLGA